MGGLFFDTRAFLAFLTFTSLVAISPTWAQATQQRELIGRVFHLDKYGEEILEKAVAVTLAVTGTATITNDQGRFRLPIARFYQPGELIEIIVAKDGWKIRYPVGGEVRIPANAESDSIEIELLPVGSPLFLGPASLENLIRNRICNSVQPTELDNPEPKLDLSRSIGDWAQDYGLTPELAKLEIDRWIVGVQSASTSTEYQRGLAAFAREQFEEAAHHFELAANAAALRSSQLATKRAKLRTEEAEIKREASSNYRYRGLSYYYASNFEAAIGAYRKALAYTSPEGDRLAWATLQNDLGNALRQYGSRSASVDATRLLTEAVTAHGRALATYSREQRPQDWARTQSNLAYSLEALGTRLTGKLATEMLARSAAACYSALEVQDNNQSSEDWAWTQHILGNILTEQGDRLAGESAGQLLSKAVVAYNNALKVRTRAQHPQEWAATQKNLGNALNTLGSRSVGKNSTKFLAEAATAYRRALEVYTPEQRPQDWARTQSSLGIALNEQGIRSTGQEAAQLLAEAVNAYRSSLLLLNRQELAQSWAWVQDLLGTALSDQATFVAAEASNGLLSESILAYRAALEVYSREHLPQQWAMAQNNLGAALQEKAQRASGAEATNLLGEALAAYRRALEVFTREGVPQYWAWARANEGVVLELLGQITEAVAIFHEVLEVDPEDWLAVEHLLNLYGGRLQDPSAAFALAENWLKRYPDHPQNAWLRSMASTWLFSSGNFSGCIDWSSRLYEVVVPDPNWRIQAVYTIASLLALSQLELSLSKLDSMIATIFTQPGDSNIEWNLENTLAYVRDEPELANRETLVELFEALHAPDRDRMLSGLRRVHDRVVSGEGFTPGESDESVPDENNESQHQVCHNANSFP